jgi:hypothetical protein
VDRPAEIGNIEEIDINSDLLQHMGNILFGTPVLKALEISMKPIPGSRILFVDPYRNSMTPKHNGRSDSCRACPNYVQRFTHPHHHIFSLE